MNRPNRLRELLEKLNQRPGRGGVRLSYEEAQLAREAILMGARAVKRLRR